MTKDTSKKSGQRSRRPQGTDADNAKGARRPPIIDVEATEIPADEKTKDNGQPHKNSPLSGRVSNWMNNLRNWSGTNWRMFVDGLAARFSPLWFVTGLLTAVILALVAYGLMPSRTASVIAQQKTMQGIVDRLSAIETGIGKINLAASKGEPKVSADLNRLLAENDAAVKQQQAWGLEVQSRLDALSRDLAAGNSRVAPELEKIANQVAALRKQAADADRQRLALKAALAVTAEKLTGLDAQKPAVPTPPSSVAMAAAPAELIGKLKTAGEALISKMATAEPFRQELDAYIKIASGDPLISFVAGYAQGGTMTFDQLRERAAALVQKPNSSAQSQPEVGPNSLIDKVVEWSRSFIRIRRKADVTTPQDNAWRQVTDYLKSSDLKAAIALAQSQTLTADRAAWLKNAEARFVIDRNIELLKSRLDDLKPAELQQNGAG